MTLLQERLIGFFADLMLPEHKREAFMMATGLLMTVMGGTMVYETAGAPENTTETGLFQFTPDAGYRWKKPNSFNNYSVVWAVGSAHPEYAHVIAAPKEGQWQPEDGYEFIIEQPEDEFAVQWRPGVQSYLCPHVFAGAKEGTFAAEDGYVLKDKGTCKVAWQEGLRLDHRPHMSAASREGEWKADPGYVIEMDQNGNLVAVEPRPVIKPRLPEFCEKPRPGALAGFRSALCEGMQDARDVAEIMQQPQQAPRLR